MNNSPLVSICIPLYNAEQYIADVIHKLQQQSYANIEIVIVDDHSTDNSLNIAKMYESDSVRVFTNPRKGGNAARNYAFSMSRGEYIKFLDADDYCSDNMIKAQVERLQADGTELSLAFSPVRMLHPGDVYFDPPRTLDYDHTPGIELVYSILEGKGWNCPHCHLMHRNLVTKSGGWDETILKNQDGEFFARVAEAADSALSVPNEYAVWRQTGVGVSTKLSVAAHESVLRSFDTIATMLLAYRDDKQTRGLCASRLGQYVYVNYPSCKPVMAEIYRQLGELGEPFQLPRRRVLKALSALFGWRLALRMIRKFKL
ncbi:MAG: glycosyltransferase family 2 protein [Rikenellaceae bacterium]